jgi:hypothetical protein
MSRAAIALVGACAIAAVLPLDAQSTIRAIDVRRAQVFDSVEARRWPYRAANTLHVVTRESVVRRELLFRTGQPYDSALVSESARNLRALGIFRDVGIDTVSTDSGLVVRVTTVDGWTIEPSVGLVTSGSQTVASAFLSDANLLGTRIVAYVGGVIDPDRTTVLAGFDAPRVIRNRVGLGGGYSHRSDGHAASASVRYPFVSLSARAGAALSAQSSDTRVLRFVGGDPSPVDSLRRMFSLVRVDGARAIVASPRGFTRVGFSAQLRREDYARSDAATAASRTITAAAGPYLSIARPRYLQTQNFHGVGRTEDVDIGLALSGSLLAAPAAWGYERSGVGVALAANAGWRMPFGFALIGANGHTVVANGGRDSGSVAASALLVFQPGTRHLVVVNVSGAALDDPRPGGELDMGLGYGARAFPAHAFTGTRQWLANAEYRWWALPSVFGLVGVGVAGFVDHAAAWFDHMPRRSGTDAGFGLRVGSIRSGAPVVGRYDLAYRWANDRVPAGWVMSLGSGFVFQ